MNSCEKVLNRWGFVIHGDIDGFSRTIVFLHCNLSNKSSTVLNHFVEAVEKCGFPSRVWSDHGVKNVDVER